MSSLGIVIMTVGLIDAIDATEATEATGTGQHHARTFPAKVRMDMDDPTRKADRSFEAIRMKSPQSKVKPWRRAVGSSGGLEI